MTSRARPAMRRYALSGREAPRWAHGRCASMWWRGPEPGLPLPGLGAWFRVQAWLCRGSGCSG